MNFKNVFIADTSIIEDNCIIGENTKIWNFCHIRYNSIIGKNCNIGQNASIGPNVIIGQNCKIQNNVSIYDGIILEDNVFCGPSCVFTNVLRPRSFLNKMSELKKTIIKKGVTIGANSTIVCGITLGEYSFIGAGSVVIKDVPQHSLIVGNPGRLIGYVCECGEKLNNKYICPICKKEYDEENING